MVASESDEHVEGDMAEVAKVKVRREFIKNISRHVYNEAKKIKIPVLIVHGGADKSTGIENTKKFFRKLKTRKKLVIVKNANHHFSKKSHLGVLMKEARDWVKNV